MLPLHQAFEVKNSILGYLDATFAFKERALTEAFKAFVEDPETGMFKGPYISLKLPFTKASGSDQIPLIIRPKFSAYAHQVKAFQRLSARNGHLPAPVLLTTGTGSGKTESFLYPILDYCQQQAGKAGIKAIILYPMNALASDQARRIAKAIAADERLKGVVTAGLFVGEGKDSGKYPRTMGDDHIIENRDSILASPPDILLTNFKMLDYALMRGKFHSLWEGNLLDPSVLRYLVLDEIHTYDGAKGSDVANLVRRLKLKLALPTGQICPVGTSATIGSGEDAPVLLAAYATKLFGETIGTDAVVTEERLSLDDMFPQGRAALEDFRPRIGALTETLLHSGESLSMYLDRQVRLWQLPENKPEVIGNGLLNLQLVWDLVAICSKSATTVEDLIRKLAQINPEFGKVPEYDAKHGYRPREAIVKSLLALISEAKTIDGGLARPFLYVQVQIWIREMRGLMRKVIAQPEFSWGDETGLEGEAVAMPNWFCRECGATGWLLVKHENKERFELDVLGVYDKYFSSDKNLYFALHDAPRHAHHEEYEPTDIVRRQIALKDLHFRDQASLETIPIVAYRKVVNGRHDHFCPECNSRSTLNIMGQRVATLASVALSQVLSSDLDGGTEHDRKILTFTNSVQDAAHQAGFFQARNFGFNLRGAIQQVLNQVGREISLEALYAEFKQYWKQNADESGKAPKEAYLYKFFPPDHTGDHKIATYKQGSEQFDPGFESEFDHRLTWEIASEYGYDAIIGRTLEKTKSSAVRFDDKQLRAAWEVMRTWLSENNLAMISEERFIGFLQVFLHRLRIRGGVDHPYLRKYRDDRSNYFLLTVKSNPRHFLMKSFGKNTRLPRMVSDLHGNDTYDVATSAKGWFYDYYKRSFLLASDYPAIVKEFYTRLLNVLANDAIGVLDERAGSGIRNFCLRPGALLLHTKVVEYACDTCEKRLQVAGNENQGLEGAACISHRCLGHFVLRAAPAGENYYQQVYNRERHPRIYAADHTGLLDRKVRENLEKDFKQRPHFNSVNTLVATSTLEMGIDIGDLNTALNTSVPEQPSNFLQRVGRAGRDTGSALLVNFALKEAHDLYYFEDPLEMMQGTVNTPGCYLEAGEILKRHFFAYCIDSWTLDNPEENNIPPMVRHLKPSSMDAHAPTFFANRILAFLDRHSQSLKSSFRSAYGDAVADEVFAELFLRLVSRQFHQEVQTAFEDLKEEYADLRRRHQEIRTFIASQGLAEEDTERRELELFARNIRGMMKTLEGRNVLEYMTNRGILPNYAFPETGVGLHARIMPFGRSVERPRPREIEVVRSAKSAIRELVPGNTFYTQGAKLKIDALTVLDWEKEANTYRFCSECDHLQQASSAVAGNCPKCGDQSFGSASNLHRFLKLSLVKVFTDEKASQLDDKSDERIEEKSSIQRHFDFPADRTMGAYAAKGVPFGIEYVKDVTLVEVNLGLKNSVRNQSGQLTIAQLEVPRSGFVTCKACGKSTTQFMKSGPSGFGPLEAHDYHFGYCRQKSRAYLQKSDEVFEELFLYRSMTTEAIKVLLPVQEFDTDSALAMFKAGLGLGLRQYYQGSPDHIEIQEYKEYNFQTEKQDVYLILYDTIPGGTGYLSKLFEPVNFTEVIRLAYEGIKGCACQHHGKDGCYHCVLSHRQRFDQESLSREKAEQLFAKLFHSTRTWEKHVGKIGGITISGQIEESELEDRFIRLLKRYASGQEQKAVGWTWEEANVNGVVSYSIRIVKGTEMLDYAIQPQQNLGRSEGVKYATRPDFVFRCVGGSKEGYPLLDQEVEAVLPIAVYLDGYRYHASDENFRLFDDIKKRIAVQKSRQYLVWTLTWEDLGLFEKMADEAFAGDLRKDASDSIYAAFQGSSKTKDKLMLHPLWRKRQPTFHSAFNNVLRLLSVLGSGLDAEQLRDEIKLALGLCQTQFGEVSYPFETVRGVMKGHLDLEKAASLKSADAYMQLAPAFSNGNFEYQIFARVRDLHLISHVRCRCTKTRIPTKDDWQEFWRVSNLLLLVAGNAEASLVPGFSTPDASLADDDEFIEDPIVDPEVCLQYFDPPFHAIVRQLLTHGIDFWQEGDFELLDAEGQVLACAAIGIPDHAVAIGPVSEEDRLAFLHAGYRVFEAIDFQIETLDDAKR